MHKQRIAVLIATGLGLLATFLPWVTMPFVGAVYGTQGDGWYSFALFSVCLVVTLLGSRSLSMGSLGRVLACLFAILAGAVGVFRIIWLHNKIAEGSDSGDFAERMASAMLGGASTGVGVYLAIGAALAIVVLANFWSRPKPAAALPQVLNENS